MQIIFLDTFVKQIIYGFDILMQKSPLFETHRLRARTLLDTMEFLILHCNRVFNNAH